MVGPSLAAPGGMSSVAQVYRDAGLFERWSVHYLSSYLRPGLMNQLRTAPLAWLRLLAWLVLGQVRLVHVNSASRGSCWRKSLFCGLAWCFRVPYVFHVHSGEFAEFYHSECASMARAWVRWVLRHAASVVVLTPSWLDAIRTIEPGARVRVIVNPVALPNRAKVPTEPATRVLFLGRLREKKGVFDLLRALPLVLARCPGLRVCIAGDGDLDGVRRLADELGVTPAVELPGWIDGPDKDNALLAADVLVLPSYFEGLPVCVLEAMAVGVPVVATRVGGIPFALDDGRCGELVTPGDVTGLSAALLRMLTSPDRRRSLAAAARARAEDLFAPRPVVAAVEQLWQECSVADHEGKMSMNERERP